MNKKYYKFLVYLSLFLSILAATIEIVVAILTYPPFMLDMSSAKRLALLDMIALPAIMLYAALIIVDIKEKRLSLSAKLLLVLSAAAIPAGIYAYKLFDFTVAPYAYSGAALLFAPYLLCMLIDTASKREWKGRAACFVAKLFMTILLIVELLLCIAILLCRYKTIAVVFGLIFFPVVQLLCGLCRLMEMKTHCISRRVMLAFDVCAFSLALFVILRMFSQNVAFIILKAGSAIVLLALAICLIYKILNIYKKEKGYIKMEKKKISGASFHHIGIKVKDFDRSISFYTEGLGFKMLYSWGEGNERAAMLDIGNGDIMEMFAGGSDELNRENVWQHFAIHADDIDKAYECAIVAGAKTIRSPETLTLDAKPEKLTIRIAFVSGPDGEQLEFFKKM